MSDFSIKTASYEGPFNLIIDLVEKRKLFINDLSLAEVTEEYLNYLNTLPERNPREISSFVLVASTLILIKSKSLLPNLELTDEEEGDIRKLEERLRLYEVFTKISPKVKNIFGKRIIFSPLERPRESVVFLPDAQITRESMMAFAKTVLGNMPKIEKLPKVEVKKVISIEEMIDSLTERIKNTLKTSFNTLHGKAKTKEERVIVIVGFLAMLELVRQGIIHAVQEADGEDIILTRQEEFASE